MVRRKLNKGNIKSAQDVQDDIFRKMSVDRRLEIGAGLWRLMKELAGDKINYAARTNRSKTPRLMKS